MIPKPMQKLGGDSKDPLMSTVVTSLAMVTSRGFFCPSTLVSDELEDGRLH